MSGRPEAHVVGEFGRLQVAELPAHDTPFVGKSVRDTRLRQQTGLSVVGFWERGRLRPAYPHHRDPLGQRARRRRHGAQIAALNALLPAGEAAFPPVLVIGAGKVGQAAARR